jgi:hypothetical protein
VPFLVLLKLISPREWLLVALLAASGALLLHVYHAGEAKIERKDTALRAAAAALNRAAENLADIKEAQIGQHFRYIIKNPIADAPGLVCHNSAPVQSTPSDRGPGADGQATQLSDGGFNPSGALLTLLADDDAQIEGLIDTVLNLQDELTGKTR